MTSNNPRLRYMVLALLVVVFASVLQAQDKMIIQATARGTSTQLGKQFNLNIYIDGFSTAEDQQTLMTAFKTKGQDGLISALQDMKGKGRMSVPGSVGNEIKYIRELPSESGRRFRLVTDRIISFPEARNNTRSKDYSIGAIELTINPDGKSGAGTLLPATKLSVNKKTGQLEIETYQNPWQLFNFIITEKK